MSGWNPGRASKRVKRIIEEQSTALAKERREKMLREARKRSGDTDARRTPE